MEVKQEIKSNMKKSRKNKINTYNIILLPSSEFQFHEKFY